LAGALWAAASSRSTACFGVPAVVHSACQKLTVTSGIPDSFSVGVAGAFGQRWSLITA